MKSSVNDRQTSEDNDENVPLVEISDSENSVVALEAPSTLPDECLSPKKRGRRPGKFGKYKPRSPKKNPNEESQNIENVEPNNKQESSDKPTKSAETKVTKDKNFNDNNQKQSSKKRKNMSSVERLLDRFKGPFVHIDGSFRSPNYVSIINTPHDSLKPSNTKYGSIILFFRSFLYEFCILGSSMQSKTLRLNPRQLMVPSQH